ncbi:membrane protein insertase YidC [Thermomonas carbonis]|uniref:Membrane protein insertase YidC n=1 Tax=Thermomonas carbonis TaxID=1463158 RepID=A0A7G9ST04_9GAMM|nr:membrane protein insertase YidC [Thermomonas carbonis]QNN70979.1 membrane protein insertase YidC [Thermomonas carbonis]GHC03757.1 membrane protein insertase YidC [Thermomonas carbonis]
MTQTRTFLILAWLMVATLLWMEWGKERDAAAAPAPAIPTATQVAGSATPGIPVASLPGAAPAPSPVAAPALPIVRLRNDVLALELNGRDLTRAELLDYPQTRAAGSPPVVLFDADPARHFAAHSTWRGNDGHELLLQPDGTARDIVLADGAQAVEARFVATSPAGVQLRRIFTLPRGGYALRVRDELVNAGTGTWTGDIERKLERVPPLVKSGMTNPEAFSLNGAAWWSPEEKYEKRKYPDYADDGPLDRQVTGGWVGLSQHYFLGAWVPQKDQGAIYSLSTRGNLYSIAARGPQITLAPGQRFSSDATLWVGPKLADQLKVVAPGLELAMDYGIFTVLSKPIHWLLTQLHKLTHNWGWAIVLLVVVIKLLLYPLSAAQYKSMAKMRKFQPRIEQLKERYGDDKQKFQMAMLELYKKEKINPAGGCLPILIQMPVFLALYYVLLEGVELRQAPWIMGWVNDLTARDPFFILPIVNGAVMWLTQKMTPMVGMDPMQKKMMQMMPLVMAVMFAFFPAGLVLYWVTNGALGMAQQWWNTKRYAEEPAKA